MHNPSIARRKAIEYIGNDLGRRHLLILLRHIHKIHKIKTLLVILAVQFLLRLQEAIDHDHIDLVVLTYPVLSLLYPSKKVLLIALVLLR